MEQQTVLIASAFFNWSETQRMIEIGLEMHRRGHRVVFLGEGRFDHLLNGLPFVRERLEADRRWYTPERIAKMLNMEKYGNQYTTYEELDDIVQAELELIARYRPFVIVTGYRMTLTVSARIAKVKLAWCLSAVVSKAYLESVAAKRVVAFEALSRAEVKALPYQQALELTTDRVMQKRAIQTCATSQVWNKYLVQHGCEPFCSDMDIYCGDLNLMSDARELFPALPEIPNHTVFIGPILNSEVIPLSEAEKTALYAQNGRKKVLVSLGSAGSKRVLQTALEALRTTDFEVFVSVIGFLTADEVASYPPNFHFSEKYPLLEMAEHCDAALIQAGQGTLYAMLMGKCPFVSIPGPFEQRHNITNLLENFGCAKRLYAAYLTSRQVAEAMHEVLTDPRYREEAERAEALLRPYRTDPSRHAEVTAANQLEALGSIGSAAD